MKIVIAATGSVGHVTQLLPIANDLKSIGHEIRFVTNREITSVAESFGFETYPYCSIKGEQNNFLHKILTDIHKTSLEFYALFELYAKNADLIISDCHSPCASILAEHRNIPIVEVLLTPTHFEDNENKRHYFNSIGLDQTNKVRENLGLLPVDNVPAFVFDWDSLKIATFPEEFVSNINANTDVYYTNFPKVIPKPLPNFIEEFLNSGESPVVITMGSGSKDAIYPSNLWEIFYELANKFRLIVLGHKNNYIRDPKVLFVDSISHADLFPKAKCVINHGGMGTMATAVFAGVPQIAIPQMSENLFCSKLFSEVYNTKTILPDTVTLDNLVTAIVESPTVIPKIQDSGNSVIEILRKHKYIHE